MSFPPEKVQAVWEKGRLVPGYDPRVVRQDVCGAWMVHNEYGNRSSALGWEVDHIDPTGGDGLPNLRPLQWENNASKQNGPLTCPITASGRNNVRRVER